MIAIVTGASKGLGQALAQELAQQCRVLVTIARQEQVDTALTELIQQKGIEHIHLSLDLTDPQALVRAEQTLRTLLQKKAERYVLINNAGTLGPIKQFDSLSTESTPAINASFALNITAVIVLTSVFLQCCQAHLPAKIQVINISSGAGRSPYAGWGVYCASKAALDRYSEVAQLEAPFAQIVSLAPGVVDTDMQATIRSSRIEDFPSLDRFEHLHQANELQSPTQVAKKILAYSEQSAFGQKTLDDIRFIKD